MGKAAGVPVAIVRGLDAVVVRARARCRELDPPAAGGPLPMTPRVPAFVERAPVDPRVPARAGRLARRSTRSSRPRASRPRRTTRGRGASSCRHRRGARRALADGMGARWRADLDGDGVDADRVDELVAGVARQAHAARPRSCSAASPGTASTAIPTRRRQRAEWGMALLSLGAAVENLMLAAADARPRVVLGRGADLLPRSSARRARAPARVAPARARARRPPRPRRTSAGARPPVPLDDAPRLPLAT